MKPVQFCEFPTVSSSKFANRDIKNGNEAIELLDDFGPSIAGALQALTGTIQAQDALRVSSRISVTHQVTENIFGAISAARTLAVLAAMFVVTIALGVERSLNSKST